jgi:rsbT co-antagonist protein RsbR
MHTTTEDRVSALEAELAAAKSELASTAAILDAVFDKHPDGICVFSPDGTIKTNEAGSHIASSAANPVPAGDDWQSTFQCFEIDKTTPVPFDQLPPIRAMMLGEIVIKRLMFLVTPDSPQGAMIESTARPLPGGGAIAIFTDVTERERLQAELTSRNATLAARDVENRDLVARLRLALEDLSTPVIEVARDVLVLPVVGVVDSQRAAEMASRLLEHVSRVGARHAIIDVTGVQAIDTATADRLIHLARGVQMLGAQCVLSGIQPQVASTMVDLGIQLAGIATERNLRGALERCGAGPRSQS